MQVENLLGKVRAAGAKKIQDEHRIREEILSKFIEKAIEVEKKAEKIREAHVLLTELHRSGIVPLVDYILGIKKPKWTTDGINHGYGFVESRGEILTKFGREGGGFAGASVYFDFADGKWKSDNIDASGMNSREVAIWAITPYPCTNNHPTSFGVFECMPAGIDKIHDEIVAFCQNL